MALNNEDIVFIDVETLFQQCYITIEGHPIVQDMEAALSILTNERVIFAENMLGLPSGALGTVPMMRKDGESEAIFEVEMEGEDGAGDVEMDATIAEQEAIAIKDALFKRRSQLRKYSTVPSMESRDGSENDSGMEMDDGDEDVDGAIEGMELTENEKSMMKLLNMGFPVSFQEVEDDGEMESILNILGISVFGEEVLKALEEEDE